MNSLRIVLLSDSRPSRVWRFANRIRRELKGAEICGIVQRPFHCLPITQQNLARAGSGQTYRRVSEYSTAKLRFSSVIDRLRDLALWWIHGYRPHLNSTNPVTAEDLADKCLQARMPLLLIADFSEGKVLRFVKQQRPNLAIALGQIAVSRELTVVPSHGLVRARQENIPIGTASGKGLEITIEHCVKDSRASFTLTSLTVPAQPYDGPSGFTLKTDLISDDLLVQTAASLQRASGTQASKEVTEWADRLLRPYLNQCEETSTKPAQLAACDRRHRSTSKLCMDTLLLCTPFIVARNWYRRLRGTCPLLILGHHLVSDRGHRMGISTEAFWRQVRFLQRHYRIVSLSEAAELLRSGTIRVPTVVLTFDDGYADNFVNLRAVAEEAGVPVALFITTSPVSTRGEFRHDLENSENGFLPLTWEQIRYWSHGDVEFGSHTYTHFDCKSTDRTRLEREIVESKHDLENHLGMPVNFFAFPFGQPENLSAEAIDVAAAAYTYFASCFGGENRPRLGGSQRHLFRKQFYADPWELELELQSVFDLADAIKRSFRLYRGVLSFLGEFRPLRFDARRNVTPSTKEVSRPFARGVQAGSETEVSAFPILSRKQ